MAPQQILMGFASWLHYCSDVSQRLSTKLCTMFGCLLGWYTMYSVSGALAPCQNFARCKIHFVSKFCVLVYWQCHCTALQQRASANLCGVEKRAPPIFGSRPSRWASAHILVGAGFCGPDALFVATVSKP